MLASASSRSSTFAKFVCEDEIVLDASTYRHLMAVASGLGLDERYKRIVRVPPDFTPDVS